MTMLGRVPAERRPLRRRRTLTLILVVVVAALAQAAAAQAETCTYSPNTHQVFATITPGGEASLRVQGDAIAFGAIPLAGRRWRSCPHRRPVPVAFGIQGWVARR